MFFLIKYKKQNILLNASKLSSIETMTGGDDLTVKLSFSKDKFVKLYYNIDDCINVDELISNIENNYKNFNLTSFISVTDQQNVDNLINSGHQHLLSKNTKILVKISSIQMVIDNNDNDEVHLHTDDKTFVIGNSVSEIDFKIKEKMLNIASETNTKMSFAHRL